jgi:hypothetical protein
VGTISPDAVVVVFGGVLGVTISPDGAVMGVVGAAAVAGTDGTSLCVGVAGVGAGVVLGAEVSVGGSDS